MWRFVLCGKCIFFSKNNISSSNNEISQCEMKNNSELIFKLCRNKYIFISDQYEKLRG